MVAYVVPLEACERGEDQGFGLQRALRNWTALTRIKSAKEDQRVSFKGIKTDVYVRSPICS
jgi:hypothetical protein